MSCNIRVALPEDDATGNGWSARRDLGLDVIHAQKPDLISFRSHPSSDEGFEKGLATHTGFGFEGPEMDARLVGYQGIAKNPIFDSRERYEFVSAGGFWLSETPHIPGSLSWDSARAPRQLVAAAGPCYAAPFRVLNTHLDHVSQHAREEQIKMILAEAAVYAPDFPQVLTGDFNSTRVNPVLKLALDEGWANTQTAAPEQHDDGYSTHASWAKGCENGCRA